MIKARERANNLDTLLEKCMSVNDKARESANQLDTQIEKCKSVND